VKDQISTLLLHESADSVGPLILALEGQSLRVRWMGNYQEALPLLRGPNPPHLVFVESGLPGGTWVDVVKLAAEAQKAVNVVVVARLVDVRLYLEAIVGGAFDFIVPPLTGNELSHVVRCAAEDVLSRREEQACSAPLNTTEVN
jgi:DNA-binding NtrC family response regulator